MQQRDSGTLARLLAHRDIRIPEPYARPSAGRPHRNWLLHQREVAVNEGEQTQSNHAGTKGCRSGLLGSNHARTILESPIMALRFTFDNNR